MRKKKKTILVTAGPTREHIDPVRFISNLSTGTLGYAIAHAAHQRGCRVILITGPTTIPVPRGVQVVRIVSARELERAVVRNFNRCDVLFMTAAVCDFRPIRFQAEKIRRRKSTTVRLVSTTDILQKVSRMKRGQIVCGFCLETRRARMHALEKLKHKKLDLIVATEYRGRQNPFGTRRMQALLVDTKGRIQRISVRPKKAIAQYLLNRVFGMIGENRQ